MTYYEDRDMWIYALVNLVCTIFMWCCASQICHNYLREAIHNTIDIWHFLISVNDLTAPNIVHGPGPCRWQFFLLCLCVFIGTSRNVVAFIVYASSKRIVVMWYNSQDYEAAVLCWGYTMMILIINKVTIILWKDNAYCSKLRTLSNNWFG